MESQKTLQIETVKQLLYASGVNLTSQLCGIADGRHTESNESNFFQRFFETVLKWSSSLEASEAFSYFQLIHAYILK